MRILVAEDNRKVAGFLVKGLEEESYAVDLVTDGKDAISALLHGQYDAVLLDIMLPTMNGIEVLKTARKSGVKTPVLVLTARDRIEQKVEGLDAGADDYLTKPFAFDELLARLRALLRRDNGKAENALQLADLSLDCVTREVRRGNSRINLTAKEYALLLFLMRNAGRIMTRTAIVDHVWDMQFDSESNIVDVLIRYLRRKIDDDHDVKLIHTVRSVGYVMKIENT